MNFFQKQGQATRPDFDNLLRAKLSDALDADQKRNFITNLLQEMRRDGIIQPIEGKPRDKGPSGNCVNQTTEGFHLGGPYPIQINRSHWNTRRCD